ncbi:hypothetical protein BD311DRAFT_437891 [Dichomitus squalens]|uniref:Uncharacterized protein n=1 Tax=Dichomitus squalens TaxID=114155 RepID=A0A4Q9N108_9APHY|nr:hypothetical protein BD311DRAFT_437891 [Dichomitus squalens]
MAEGLSRVPTTRWTSGTGSDAQDETAARLVCGPGPGFGSSSPTPPRSAWQPGLTANSMPGSVSPLSAVPSNSPPLPPTVGHAVPGAQCPSARGSSVPGFRGPAKATTPAALPWSTSRVDVRRIREGAAGRRGEPRCGHRSRSRIPHAGRVRASCHAPCRAVLPALGCGREDGLRARRSRTCVMRIGRTGCGVDGM